MLTDRLDELDELDEFDELDDDVEAPVPEVAAEYSSSESPSSSERVVVPDEPDAFAVEAWFVVPETPPAIWRVRATTARDAPPAATRRPHLAGCARRRRPPAVREGRWRGWAPAW